MEELRKNGTTARRALMVAFVLALVVSPFFYHLVSFLLLPLIIPVVLLFFFVFFSGLTDLEQKRVAVLNIVFSVLVIGLYQGYLFLVALPQGHQDIHLNIAVWLVQILTLNLLVILYLGIRALKKHNQLASRRRELAEGSSVTTYR